uniref:Small proline rich protein 3 n=1 Tax=Suricata suricatta TaxID=37032 RepID=A0A673TWE7_SURSU
ESSQEPPKFPFTSKQKQPCTPPLTTQEQQLKQTCQLLPQELFVPITKEPCHTRVPQQGNTKISEPSYPKYPEPVHPMIPEPGHTKGPDSAQTKQK